jgi:flagellin-like hook-associated protein FlgL
VKVDISATNKFEGYEIFDGSIVAVKVTTSAFNVGATSIKVTMTYNKDVFTYIGFSADNAFGKASFDGLANTTYNPAATNAAYGADGVVTMASVAEKTANGQLQNVTLNGKETYMTLYFRVANNATSAAAPFGFEIVESTATEENTQVLGVVANATTGALETAPVKTVVGDAVELATEINKIADINGDLIIGMEDVEAMRKLVLKAAGYTAPVAGAADIDKDGDVDIDDYALLQKYILGMIDYTALANELVGTAL